jgi:hypothetical protein
MSAARVCKDCGKRGIKGNPLNKDGIHLSAYDCVENLKDRCAKLQEETEAQHHSFLIRWKADMRAIDRWQAAHPGNDLVWPDHADLVVWLLEQLEAKQ